MNTKTVNIGNKSVKIISSSDMAISRHDAEMDKRAVAAVQSAIDRAKVCSKPIARYDLETKRAYLEYADGSHEYVN